MTYVVFTIVSEKDGVLSKIVIKIDQMKIFNIEIINKLKETNQKNVIYMAHCFPNAPHDMRPTNKEFIQNINNRL